MIGTSELRDHLAEEMDKIIEDREPTLVTRPGREPVIMVARDDYRSLKETAYLMHDPANARNLLESMAQLERGAGIQRQLVDDDC